MAVLLSYNEYLKSTPYFYPIGLVIGLTANLTWLHLTKHTPEKNQLFIYGLYWDSIIVFTYMAIPLLFLGVKLDWKQVVGTILVVAGIFLTKL